MEKSQLALILSGAFMSPYGEQIPIESRWCDLIDTELLAHRQMLPVDQETIVPYGSLRDPAAVVIWNLAGVGAQKQPTETEAAANAAKVVEVESKQLLLPPPIGSGYSPACLIRPVPGEPIVLRPRNGSRVPLRVLVIPSSGH